MKRKKKPRFYCDACAAEVAANADRCPHCGKYFSAVRCPKCFWAGEQAEFAKGCPNCGYSAPSLKNGNSSRGTASGNRKNFSKKSGALFADIPSWILPLSISLFILLVLMLFFR